jgi:hypothetical protein
MHRRNMFGLSMLRIYTATSCRGLILGRSKNRPEKRPVGRGSRTVTDIRNVTVSNAALRRLRLKTAEPLFYRTPPTKTLEAWHPIDPRLGSFQA